MIGRTIEPLATHLVLLPAAPRRNGDVRRIDQQLYARKCVGEERKQSPGRSQRARQPEKKISGIIIFWNFLPQFRFRQIGLPALDLAVGHDGRSSFFCIGLWNRKARVGIPQEARFSFSSLSTLYLQKISHWLVVGDSYSHLNPVASGLWGGLGIACLPLEL